MADPRAQIPLELFAHRLLQFVHFAGESGGLRLRTASRRGRRALNLCRLAHHRVVAELPDLVFVERPASQFLLAVHLLLRSTKIPMVRSPRDAPDSMAMSSFSSASPGVMFSMAAASLATLASPTAFDRFMSATMSRSTAWMASWVPKPTFLTASTRSEE